jgi:hypothetical protein
VVSKIDMPWLIPLCLCLALLALVTAVFVASVRNARALRRDLDERFDAAQARLEKQANTLADELLARTKDTTK